MQRETIVSVMVEVGIAIYGGGDPYKRLRVAKNQTSLGTSNRRLYETLLKQPVSYLQEAAVSAAKRLKSCQT